MIDDASDLASLIMVYPVLEVGAKMFSVGYPKLSGGVVGLYMAPQKPAGEVGSLAGPSEIMEGQVGASAALSPKPAGVGSGCFSASLVLDAGSYGWMMRNPEAEMSHPGFEERCNFFGRQPFLIDSNILNSTNPARAPCARDK